MFFNTKKIEPIEKDSSLNKDLAIITQMNQEFATSLDLSETLQTALEVIIKRINAQAANIFLIDDKKQVFQCIASKYQSYLDEYEIPLTQGVMGKAVLQKKCIRVGDVRKDVREIAEFYFDLDNKTNFTTYSVLCSPLIAANECIGVIHCLNKKTDDNDSALIAMRDQVEVMQKLLNSNYSIREFGSMLHQGWLKKRSLATTISSPQIDNWYQSALDAAAYGGKLCGAGGGGFLLFIAPPQAHDEIRKHLYDLKEERICFEPHGVRTIVQVNRNAFQK